MDNFKQVLLVAGTHGNELSGIYVNKLIEQGLYQAQRASFTTQSIIANPAAVKRNVRFVDQDLNRQFLTPEAADASLNEVKIAQQLTAQYDQVPQQLVVDMHNTTSHMGATLILLESSPFYQQMGAFVKQQMPEAYILFEDQQPLTSHPYLCTLGGAGIMLEIGAQSHGVLQHDCLQLMKKMLTAVLDFIDLHNQNQLPQLPAYEAFRLLQEVAFPLDEKGHRAAMVHPAICGKDYHALNPGDPMFIGLDGSEFPYQGDQTVYPHFINESAYSAADLALALADKITVQP
ncbi:aspartoacylase [Motilimonas pumila]|uniref:Aspartoacylase n=1 Tax=Motilimonas pumila TaxID=2303987 RepID=A0A418YE37_9GAMM|nr:aspartoacylase [Motilimonas pumila]RJG47424.1 aspartoacylase [Motilimonas pumila]